MTVLTAKQIAPMTNDMIIVRTGTEERNQEARRCPSNTIGDRRHRLQHNHADVADDVADDWRQNERNDVERVHDDPQLSRK